MFYFQEIGVCNFNVNLRITKKYPGNQWKGLIGFLSCSILITVPFSMYLLGKGTTTHLEYLIWDGREQAI